MSFKPMLGVTAKKDKIKFPAMTSLKLDGIRCCCINGELFSRSLKPIGNIQLRNRFKAMMDYSEKHKVIFDGEFYAHGLTFQEITSMVNSSDKEVSDDLRFNCFDFIKDEKFSMSFKDRNALLSATNIENVVNVEQIMVKNINDIDDMFKKALDEGYEGLIVRCPNGEYKFGRSTVNEGLLLKVKPFETFDTVVIGIEERNENLNESHKNELGHSFKRNTKADKKGTGIAATLVAMYNGHEVKPTLTGNEAFRREIWENKESYIGKMFEYKGMKVGMKDVPRHPNFVRWRKDKDG